MKPGVLFGFILVFFEARGSSSAINECENSEFKGKWICVRNDENTFNVTFDCSLNEHKIIKMRLQHFQFPLKVKFLRIQNCDTLYLDTSCEDDKMTYFSHFHVTNITRLLVQRGDDHVFSIHQDTPKFSLWNWESLKSERYKFFTILPESNITNFSLVSLVFENIETAVFSDNLDWFSTNFCGKNENKEFESFTMINITGFRLNKNFSLNFRASKMFLIDRANSAGLYPVNLHFENKSIVKITKSYFFSSTAALSLRGNVTKFMIVNNYFEQLPTDSFNIVTDEFLFSGNRINRMRPRCLNVESFNLTISNNRFLHMDDQAISHQLRAKQANRFNIHSTRTYNFSNNVIFILEQESLALPKMKSDASFRSLVISNNLIDCSCQNVNWFKYLSENKSENEHFYNIWTKKSNQNKCSNVENCSISQALLNFYEFCEHNYQCPVNISLQNSSFSFDKHVENASLYLRLINDAIADSKSNAIKISMDEQENNKKLLEDLNQLISLHSVMASCFVIFLILVCLVCFYFIWFTLPKHNCFKFKLMNFKSVETELDSLPS